MNANTNEMAWDKKVQEGASWTVEIAKEELDAVKKGDIKLFLGMGTPIPRSWLPQNLQGLKVLCLASGGGQQGPIFATLGCDTTVIDLSRKQLDKDILVAKRDNLAIRTIKADMQNLSMLQNEEFDIVFCPVSVTYIDDTMPVFQEVYRVLKPKGLFLLGAVNPHIYLFDGKLYDEGIYTVSNVLPFNSLDELNEEEQKKFIQDKNAIEYSHTMASLIGNQLACGFALVDFFESNDTDKICKYFSKYYNMKSIKM